MIRVSAFDTDIVISAVTWPKNEAGQPKQTLTTALTTRGMVEFSGGEKNTITGERTSNSITVITHRNAAITNKAVATIDGIVYNITSVQKEELIYTKFKGEER